MLIILLIIIGISSQSLTGFNFISCMHAEVACWMYTGERQAAKMRMAYLRSMLSQDISLFDTEASTGEVISAITSDIIVVQDALSEKVCVLIYR